MKSLLKTRSAVFVIFIAGMVCFCACHSTKTTTQQKVVVTTPASLKGQHPEHFTGTLPCADCSGIGMDLWLGTGFSPNGGHFEMAESYLGKGSKVLQSKGNWAYSFGDEYRGMKVVILNSDKEKKDQRYFLRLPDGNLEMLDREMKRIKSDLNYVLVLQGGGD